MTAEQSFDIFLSHNSRDKPAVERLAQHLQEAGLQPWLDKWHLPPGWRWQEELAAGLRGCTACAVFVGPHGCRDHLGTQLFPGSCPIDATLLEFGRKCRIGRCRDSLGAGRRGPVLITVDEDLWDDVLAYIKEDRLVPVLGPICC